IVPLMKNKSSEDKLDRQVLMLQRILIPILVIGGILIAQNEPDFITELMWLGIGLFTGSVIPALVIGSLWKGVTRKAAEISSSVGFLTFLILLFGVGIIIDNELLLFTWSAAGASTIVNKVLVLL